jgi:protein tyrosine phosphatase (PTP) superfamily phosphohydrolase (DUF442 family)
MIVAVDSHLSRGPRPCQSEISSIKAQFATVISLEGLSEDEKEAKELVPVDLLSHPISFGEIYFTGISQEALQMILDSINSAGSPVFLHCEHGEDRTGLIVAAYRVIMCGWKKDAAMTEALHFGYRNWLNFGLNKTWNKFNSW